MKNFERKNKNERRRVLLSKNNELSYYLDNEKLRKGGNGIPAGGVSFARTDGVALRAALTNRMRAIIAVLVAIAVLLPGIFIGVHVFGAENKTYFTELSSTDPQANTSLTKNYHPGDVYYYYQPDDRTYTYYLDTELVPGDTVTFNEETKNIVWNHHAADTLPSDSVNITSLMDLNQDSSGDNLFVFDLKANSALNPGTTYYYDAGETTYLFEVPDFVGYKAGKSATNRTTRDYYMRDPEKTVVDVKLTLDTSDPNNLAASLSGDQLTRHTIYVNTTTLHDYGVYLITKGTSSEEERIVKYSANYTQSSIKDTNCDSSHFSNTNHKYYKISNPVVEVNGISTDTFYNQDGTDAFSNDEIAVPYIDSIQSSDTPYLKASERLLPEFQAQINSSYFYLAGYDSSGDTGAQGKYTTKKVLGSIFNNNSSYYNYIYVYDLCDYTKTDSWISGGATHHHNGGSLWRYDANNSALINDQFEFSSNSYLGAFAGTERMNRVGAGSTTPTYLYELKNVYDKEAIDETPFSVTSSGDASGLLEVTDVTYTDSSAVAGNNLEIDKTVKTIDKEQGIYDIRLEAFTTASSLNQPATDIMLILDTSKNMTNTLYTRDFQNLNTYEGFKEINLKTGTVTHDSLFDRDWDGVIGSLSGVIGNWFAESRDYIHNKYVEDPAAPGTYVYLHQKYDPDKILGIPVVNKYSYYFTSSDGTTYNTGVTSQNILGTGLDPAVIPSTGLVFTAPGKPSVTRTSIYTLANYAGKNTDNGSPATNKNLYSVHQSTGLYIKDKDGNFRRVFMYKNRMGNGTHDGVAKTGMYRYVIYEGDTQSGAVEYEFSTGSDQTLNDGTTPASDYGVFQGFRTYDSAHNLVGDYILSKTLYTRKTENVTALQAMKESMESFLLNAHEQVAGKGAEAYVGLVAYDKGSDVMYGLKPGSGVNYTDLSLTVGNNSVDLMISDIYNYVVSEYKDGSGNTHKYNVIPANVAHVDDVFYRFKGTYAAEIDSGMTDAKNQLQNYNHNKTNTETGGVIKSRRFAVLFTAGVPSAYTTNLIGVDNSGTFTTGTADRAIATANTIKNSLDTTFYTVGLFDNAKPGKINGKYWYYAFSDKVPCSGKVRSYWGGSWLSNFGFSMDPKDAYATNRMLEYISSDYMTTTELGLTRGKYSPSYSGFISNLITRGTGYRIDRNFTKSDTGYYMAVSPKNFDEDAASEDQSGTALDGDEVQAILNDVFQALNIATASPKNTLDAQSFLVDGITNYFDLVTDVPVKAEVMDANDQVDQALTAELIVDPSTVSSTTKTISVKGFDYSTHWIGSGNTNPQRKVVLTFRVKRTDGEIGGNSVPTNLSKTAIYDGDENSITDETPWGIMEERFEIPKVDLPIQMEHFTKDASIYFGNTQELDQLLDMADLSEIVLAGDNGMLIPNEFVTIAYEIYDGNNKINTYTVPAGMSTGKWTDSVQEETGTGIPGEINEDNLSKIFAQPEQSTSYRVKCVVTPVYNGTVGTKTYDNNTANIYVFDPHYTTYNGTVENAGDEYDLTATGKTPALTEWKYDEAISLGEGDTATEKLAEITAMLDKEKIPTITYDLNKYVDQTQQDPKEGTNKNTFPYENNTVSQNTESTAGDLDDYVVNEKHDLIMNNVQVTASPSEYTIIQQIAKDYYDSTGVIYKTINLDENGQETTTVFYDENGQEMPDATTGRTLGTDDDGNQITVQDTPEAVYGEITRTYAPSLNASQKDKVTFNNASDNREVGASFTLGFNSHDVTITNHTVKSEDAEADYADRTRAFPLTITLKDGNNPVVGETIRYTDPAGNPQTATTDENGQFVINLKHEETATLAEIRDGYTLTVTSDPSDAYHVGYKYAEGDGALGPAQNVDIQTESATFTVSDDLRIDVTHSIDDIPITGYPDKNALFNPFFILAAMLTLSGGAWGGYTYKLKKEQELATYLANQNK